ncbi:MAG: acyl-[acyl-carrier-protein]--UDP-N-acetylglucosamine O-acyltransferase, partial [Flammeovirgaceae bacterium]
MSNNYLHPDSKIGKNTKLEPFSYIDADVEIGDNCWIGNNVTI